MTLQGPHPVRGVEASKDRKSHFPLRARPGPARDGGGEEEEVLLGCGPRQAACMRQGSVARTWQAPSYLSLSVPPTWDPADGRFACVVNGNKVLLWDGEETKLDKVKEEVDVSGVVFDLLELGGGLVAVFQDGSAQTLRYLQRNPSDKKTGHLPNCHKLKDAKILSRKSRSFLVLHSEVSSGGPSSVTSLSLTTQADSGKLEVEATDDGVFSVSKGEMILDTLQTWSGPSAFVAEASGSLTCITLPMPGKGSQQLAKFPCPGGSSKPLFARALGDDFAAVIYSPDKSLGNVLRILSLRFGSAVCELDLGRGDVLSGMATLGKSKIFLSTAGGSVQQVNASDLPSSLDSMIGILGGSKAQRRGFETEGGEASKLVRGANVVSGSVGLYHLLPKMFRDHDVDGVAKILLYQKNEEIPELLLLACVEFLIKTPDKAFKSKSGPSPQVRRESLLSAAFTAPFTEPLMSQYLAKVDSETASKMLEFLDLSLRLHLAEQRLRTENGEEDDEEGGSSSLERTIAWVSLILNSRYNDVVVSRDPRAVELVSSLSSAVASCEEGASFALTSLMPLLEMTKDGGAELLGGAGERALARRDYCIEIINL